MTIGRRFFLAVFPAVVGLLAVAALTYWGRREYQAPAFVIAIAIAASVCAVLAAWYNARYLAGRMERLAQLAQDVRAARDDGRERERAAEARSLEHLSLLDDVMQTIAARLEEAHLPLHILLSSPFGALNENQEEMLGAAERAVDAADSEARKLARLVALDRGLVPPEQRPISVAELLRPPLAIARARAAAAGVQVRADLPGALPRVLADPLLVQDALTTVLTRAVARTPAGGDVVIDAGETDDGSVRIAIAHGTEGSLDSLDARLAQRLVAAQGGAVHEESDLTTIQLHAETPTRTVPAPAR